MQNNFTTIEQSKRLLELGVPADSADCYYHHYFTNDPTPLLRVLQLQWDETIGAIRGKTGQKIEPCWSVGRLIEIFELCYTDRIDEHVWYNHPGKGNTIVERVMWDFNDKAEKMNFSKLEE